MNQRIRLRKDLSDPSAWIQPAQCVEVMNQRFVEDGPGLHPRGHLRGNAGIAGQRAQQLGSTDGSGDNRLMRGGEVGVEAPVEAHLQRHPGLVDRGDGPVGVIEGQRHRLLAEDVLTGSGRGDHEIGVSGRGRADRHRVDAGVGDQLVRIGVGAGRADRLRRFQVRICHRDQGGVVEAASQRRGVEAADPPGADQAEAKGHRNSCTRTF